MRLSIASGKGGTGKTLIATSLARLWADNGRAITYVDADAEEPNGHLFLKPAIRNEHRFSVNVPTLNGKTCEAHGKCQEICAFNAILAAKGSVIVFDELCHSCGACILACPGKQLKEKDRDIGTISRGNADGVDFFSAKLDVGEARVTPLIAGVIDQAAQCVSEKQTITIVDSPPGTSCSAMAAVEKADLLLLVTEPTPFGLHDLKLAIDMGRALGRPLAAVINRSDIGDDKTQTMLERESVPILGQIPFDRAVAESYAISRLAIYDCQRFRKEISLLADKLYLIMKESAQ